MTMQLDLFGGPAAPVQGVAGAPEPLRRVNAAAIPPPAPTAAWARLLDASPYAVEVYVSWRCTGVVVESLDDPQLGRVLLYSDGQTGCFADRKSDRRVRTLYLLPDAAAALHRDQPLLRIGPFGSQRYRFAAAGEDAPAELPLPGKPL